MIKADGTDIQISGDTKEVLSEWYILTDMILDELKESTGYDKKILIEQLMLSCLETEIKHEKER